MCHFLSCSDGVETTGVSTYLLSDGVETTGVSTYLLSDGVETTGVSTYLLAAAHWHDGTGRP